MYYQTNIKLGWVDRPSLYDVKVQQMKYFYFPISMNLTYTFYFVDVHSDQWWGDDRCTRDIPLLHFDLYKISHKVCWNQECSIIGHLLHDQNFLLQGGADMERYVSFSVGDLRFMDSFQFMTSSLETLVNNLAGEGLSHFKQFTNIFKTKDSQIFIKKKCLLL